MQPLLRVADPKIASLRGRILQGRAMGRTDVQVKKNGFDLENRMYIVKFRIGIIADHRTCYWCKRNTCG